MKINSLIFISNKLAETNELKRKRIGKDQNQLWPKVTNNYKKTCQFGMMPNLL